MSFTAQQLFDRTIAMMGISAANATTYADSYLQQANVILADCFTIENSNRLFQNPALAVLATIPTVATLATAIDYQEEMLQVMAYGIAMYLSLSDDETVKTQFFNVQYEEAKARSRKMVPVAIVDYFSAEDTELV